MENETTESLFNFVAAEAAAFRRGVANARHAPAKSYHECLAAFGGPAPEDAASPGKILEELVRGSEDALLMATGPRFFGWVMGSSNPVAVAADWMSTVWGQHGAHPTATPATAAVEAVAERWILEMLDLPRQSSIGFTTGATVANFTCLAAARGEVLRQLGWDVNKQGLFGAPPISVLIGEEAHSTVFMALQYLGLGNDRVVKIAVDKQGTVRPDAFDAEISKVKGPAIVILQAGHINSGDFDPFAKIVPMAKRSGAWVHVDGAFGLWARVSPKLRSLTDGIDLADSWATDGHKWPQVPYDCGFAIVRDEASHRRSMSISASYLPNTQTEDRVPINYVPELSRRARGNAVWAVIRALGRRGIAEMVERHCQVARAMADALAREPGVEIVNKVVINQVAVRFGSDLPPERGDELTRRTIGQIQSDGVCFAGGAIWHGREIMRISVSSQNTSEEDGRISVEAMIRAYRKARLDL